MRRFFTVFLVLNFGVLDMAYGNDRQVGILSPEVVPSQDQLYNVQRNKIQNILINSTPGLITFDDYPVNTVITDQYKAKSVVFAQSVIELDNLPGITYLSGDNESYPTPYGNGKNAAPIIATFLAPTDFIEADPIYLEVGSVMTIEAFNRNGTLIGNARGSSRLRVKAKGIMKAVFSFFNPNGIDDIAGIDNLNFDPKPIVILDPGHGLLLDKDGVTLHYQRPATPTFALHEDDITLSIASAAKSQLEKNKYTVYLTREGSLAPITEVGGTGCGSPKYDYCNDDLRMRVKRVREYDYDKDSDIDVVFVSVHTNGSDIPLVGKLKNGTESYYCSGNRDYSPLAQGILDNIVALGTANLGIYDGCDKGMLMRMSESKIPNSLVEVAYHSNTVKISSPTDEELLNDPVFRTSAGNAIATAIDQFTINLLNGSK